MLEHLEWCSHVVLILVELGEGLSRNVWQATEVVLGPGSDLEVDVGFEGTIQEPELDSSSSSMFDGRGMSGTFLLRKRLTTVTGNMIRI